MGVASIMALLMSSKGLTAMFLDASAVCFSVGFRPVSAGFRPSPALTGKLTVSAISRIRIPVPKKARPAAFRLGSNSGLLPSPTSERHRNSQSSEPASSEQYATKELDSRPDPSTRIIMPGAKAKSRNRSMLRKLMTRLNLKNKVIRTSNETINQISPLTSKSPTKAPLTCGTSIPIGYLLGHSISIQDQFDCPGGQGQDIAVSREIASKAFLAANCSASFLLAPQAGSYCLDPIRAETRKHFKWSGPFSSTRTYVGVRPNCF